MRSCFVRLGFVAVLVVGLFLLGTLFPQSLAQTDRAWNWLTDTNGPEIAAEVPTKYIHGPLVVPVTVADESGAEVTAVTVDGQPVASGTTVEIDTAALPDGEHTLAIESADGSYRKNATQSFFTFQTDNTPPTVTVKFDPPQVGQGHTLAIQIDVGEPVSLTATLDGQGLSLLSLADRYVAVLGFAPDSKLGPRRLDLLAVDKAGLQVKANVPVTVTQVFFPTESLIIPEDRSDLLNPAIVEAENGFLAGVFAAFTPEKLWSGPFRIPAQGVVSSPFAIRRSYNGGPFGSHHGGIDFAIAEGVPVAAANAGRVAVAEPLKVRGNVVILDHGLGVFSAYYHLSQIRVQKGALVDKGQIVGLVGNTGLSTGAHLHWEMRVSGAAVDPEEWTTRTIP